MTDPQRGEPITRIAFLGTPPLAAVVLDRLVEAGIEIVTVVTAAPTRRGRGSAEQPTPVGRAAARLGLQVAHDPAAIIESGAQIGVVVAYGHLLRAPVLGSMPLVNLHFSKLPRWRGAAPVERAILAGDPTTAVCVMEIEAGLDTGPVYAAADLETADKTLERLWDELAELGATLLIDQFRLGLSVPQPQDGDVTHAAKLDKSERCLDPTCEGAEMLCRRVRLGGAWTTLRDVRLGVLSARRMGAMEPEFPDDPQEPGAWVGGTGFRCVDGTVLELVEVQPPGRRAIPAIDWARGVRLGPADRLAPAASVGNGLDG